MHIPALIHPTRIGLTQLDLERTPKVHPQLREPMGNPVYRDEVVLTAQVAIGEVLSFRQRAGGNDPPYHGTVVFHRRLLAREAPGVALHIGDRVTRLYVGTPSEMAVDFYIERIQPAGQYGEEPELWLCYYRDLKTQAKLRG